MTKAYFARSAAVLAACLSFAVTVDAQAQAKHYKFAYDQPATTAIQTTIFRIACSLRRPGPR